MTLDEDVSKIKKDVEWVKNNTVKRPGDMVRGCFSCLNLLTVVTGAVIIGNACNRIYQIHKVVVPEIQIKQVVGGPELETFYERDGKKFYLEIDGKPVEDYVLQK